MTAGNTRIPEGLDRLIEFYSATNDPDEAMWRADASRYPEAKPMPRLKK